MEFGMYLSLMVKMSKKKGFIKNLTGMPDMGKKLQQDFSSTTD